MKRFAVSILFIVAALSGCNDTARQELIAERGSQLISQYVSEFNAADEELYAQRFSNSEAETFMTENVPAFECPDKELEKTYYFRWWTFRKHVKTTPEGYVISEFLPDEPCLPVERPELAFCDSPDPYCPCKDPSS